MNGKCFLAGSLFLLFTTAGLAQSARDLRINEIVVHNDSGYIDDFGRHNPWIEIFNSAYNYVDIAGCYLTNDIRRPTLYPVPKGDPVTRIAPRNYLVFWADNQTTHGIRHLSFDLRESRFIALFDADGRTLIDSMTIGAHPRDVSYGNLEDGGPNRGFLEKITPGANNDTSLSETSAQQFQRIDPVGIGMAMIALSIVFLVLMMLFVFFKRFSKTIGSIEKVKEQKRISALRQTELPDEETIAAITLALQRYVIDQQEHEDMVLTIKKVSKTYSPWNSKIYGVGAWSRMK